MGSNTAFIYGDEESGLIKVIADPSNVRVKLCPQRVDPATEDERFDEGTHSVSSNLDRRSVNRLIKDLRIMRDRVFGRDE